MSFGTSILIPPEPSEVGGRAQFQELCLLPLSDVQGIALEHLSRVKSGRKVTSHRQARHPFDYVVE